ncbi:MAG: hypothetical protein CSA74_02680 [Rhodobacterales bacterium]|nr:MAG: hypothetical protein CSA74_02680 [Rhodobacterales bacterium]
MIWIGAVAVAALLLWLAFGKRIAAEDRRARMQEEEQRIARSGGGPFSHRSVLSVVMDVLAKRQLMGAQVTPEDMRADAAYVLPPIPKAADGRLVSRTVYRTTWVARLMTPVVSAVFLAVILHVALPEVRDIREYLSEYRSTLAVLLLLAVFGNMQIWLFRAEIEGDTIRVRMPWLAMQSYRLQDLRRIHDDDALHWRLVFADGRRPLVLKFVAGADDLRQRLAGALEANGRG